MKIIHKYIFIELLKLFCISVLFLMSLMFLDKFFIMTQMILEKNVTFIEMARIVGYISPSLLAITIPVSIFVATVIGFNQFSVSSEFDAMKASGYSFVYVLKPALLLGFIAYIACNIIIFHALPWGNKSFTKLILHIVKTRANIDIKPKVFNTDFKEITIYAKGKKNDNTYTDIFIADNSATGFSKVILSRKGTIATDPDSLTVQLKLRDGTIHDQSQKGKNYKLLKFDTYSISLTLPGFIRNRIFAGNKELSFSELREEIHASVEDGRKSNMLKLTLSKKFSLPITCLLFAMLGAPLGINSSRSGKSGAYLISALGILTYYILLNTVINLARLGKINPYFSVWIPNIILLAIALFMIWKTQRELPFTALNRTINFALAGYYFFRNIYYKWTDKSTADPKRAPATPKT